MNLVCRKLLFGILLFGLTVSCQKDEPKVKGPEVDFVNGEIQDFALTEVSYLGIKILQPEVVDGVEKKYGEIEITIPKSHKSLVVSLKETNLDVEKFSVSPKTGVPQDFSKGPVIYTITSIDSPDKVIHYNVKVVYEGEPLLDLKDFPAHIDFSFSKVSILSYKISSPKIENGLEKKYGEVEITIPRSYPFLQVVEVSHVDFEQFGIAPANKTSQDFSKGPITYSVTSLKNPNKVIHYNVNLVYGGEPLIPLKDFPQLKDVPLSGVSYTAIKIVHPEIVEDVEKKYGEIEITVSQLQQNLILEPIISGFDVHKFDHTPKSQQDFSNGPITYSIVSSYDANRAIHYNIKIVYENKTNTKITGFKFEKDKNPSLATTIEALKIVDYENSTNSTESAIYVIVPVGTDFSKLIPTIEYDAANLTYSERWRDYNDVNFKPYPKEGMVVDFKYPKAFRIKLKNSNGSKTQYYEVIVDVKNPIKFVEPTITTPDINKGEKRIHLFRSAGSWINQGNHPIRAMAMSNYKDKIYPFTGYTGDIITTLLTNPKIIGGVLPGESGFIDVTFRATTFGDLDGIYKTTAEITPTFRFDSNEISNWPVDDRIESIFETQSFTIQTTIK